MRKIENIVATLWEYTNKMWETKKNYLTIGKLFTWDDGRQRVKITNLPVGDWNWTAGVYPPKSDDTIWWQ